MKYRLLPLVISIFLALVPFLWLKSGYLDLGGDSSRLYFFDPLNYLKSFPLWGIAPDGLGAANISYSLIPFVLTLLLFKQILHSPYLLITLFNSVQLVVSFLSVYLITIEFLRIGKKNNEIASIYFAASIAGLFYILSPFLSPNGWDKAMFIHNQLFLNPLIFFIVLKYIHSIKIQYLLFILIITFIFAPNFSPSPSVFAFYPLAFSYLLLYAIKIRKIRIPLNHVFFMLFLFLSVHLFHLAPFINNVLFVDTSVFHQATFSEEGRLSRGLGYFLSVAQATKFTNNLLSLPQGESSVTKGLDFLWIIFPMILTISLVLHKRFNAENKSRVLNFLLLFVFFLIVLFLITGNFTEIGLSIYKSLFYIPGFAMFRNYVGQFAFVFIFFYAILLGQSLFYLLLSLKSRQKWIIYSLLLLVITISSLPFIKGDMINLVLNRDGKTKVRVPIKMDPVYEEVLIYIRENKIDGKYLTLPLTEAGLQILAGKEGGAYLGPSTIAYLAGKKDFSGYQVLSPFSDLFLHLVKNKNYESLNNLLALLNIKYIFYNSDSYIYGENFPNLPYQHVNKFMPKNQKLYREFIENLAVKKIRSFGNKYHLYEVKNEGYLPHIHIAKSNLKVTINDIGHAFDFYPIISEPTVIATSIATPRVGNESNTQNDNFLLESNKVDIYKRISKSFPIPVRYPFARWNPESIVYPLLIIKEKRQQESFKNLGDSYIDSKLFFSAKRISEIARWEGGYRVSKDIRNSRDLVNYFPRDIKSQIINWFGRYTSWEVALSRYFQGIEEAINFIERSKTSRAQKIERKSKVHQSIVDNQIVLNTIINRSETLKENKTYLLQLLDELFDYYLQQVKQDEFNPSRIEYSIDNKIGNNIPFEVYIKKSTLGGADMKNVTLEILNSKLRPKEISPKDSLIHMGSVVLPQKETLFYMNIERENIVKDQLFNMTSFINVASTSSSIIINSFPGLEGLNILNSGFTKMITNWEPKSHYLLSFDYLTGGNDFNISLFVKENKKRDEDEEYILLFDERKNTRKWRRFNAIIESNNIDSAIFDIRGTEKKIKPISIEIKNLSVVKLPPQENILFRSASKPNVIVNESTAIPKQKNFGVTESPSITFTRINPTLYTIDVKGAKNPYTLVFLDHFNKDWKLYVKDARRLSNTKFAKIENLIGSIAKSIVTRFLKSNAELGQQAIVASYFNGDIKQNGNHTKLLSPEFFEMWGRTAIAENGHYQANGYANAWDIMPSDVEEKEDYTLVLEMTSQRLFYITFFVSLVTMLFVAILSLVLVKWIKKR